MHFTLLTLGIPLLMFAYLQPFAAEEPLPDNDFADFDNFDDDEDDVHYESTRSSNADNVNSASGTGIESAKEDEIIVEDINMSFDEEIEDEYEGPLPDSVSKDTDVPPNSEKPKLSILKYPIRSFDKSFIIEITLGIWAALFGLNLILGSVRNRDIMLAWLKSYREVLLANFALVGDTVVGAENAPVRETDNVVMVKKDENTYAMWCSGRQCCEGMLVELLLIKRQDLIMYLVQHFQGVRDEVHFKFSLSKEHIDTYTFCVVAKKYGTRFMRDLVDVNTFCGDKRANGKLYGIPSNFTVISEFGEVAQHFFDPKTVAAFEKFKDVIEYVHISDRYSGYKMESSCSSDTDEKPPEHKRMFLVGLSLPSNSKGDEREQFPNILPTLFYWLDKMNKFRLSKEFKLKAHKKRQRVDETLVKLAHVERSEAAAQRKEEKLRKEKERILQEEDPLKQRKLEEKEKKKEMKKRVPKLKQLKVKSI